MDDLQFKASSGQLNVDEAKGIVECFVAAVGNKDSVGDIVAHGAFDGSLRRRKPRVVWGHDWNQPIGKVLAIEEVGPNDPRLPMKMKQAGVGGLLARVQFNLLSERGKEAFASVAFFGEDQEWSIGYKTIRAEYDPAAQANVLQEVELFEVSPVLHGANQLTGTISVKSADEDRLDSFQKSKWPMFDRSYAANLKDQHPDIWAAGGNIKGNDQYEILTKIAAQGGKATTEDQIKALELREAWIARHHADFRLPGIIAQIKWLAIGSRGEDHMKKVIADKVSAKQKKMSSKGYEYGTDDHEAMEQMMGRRRVLMSYAPDGSGFLRAGRQEYGFHQADDDGVYIQKHPGLGDALAATMRSDIELQMVRENFAIFSAADDDGEMEDYFVSYHFDRDNNRYMFSEPFEVDVEVTVNFENEDNASEYAKSFDMAAGFADLEVKAIGNAIGPVGPAGNPNDMIDHDGDGMIFDGTPNEQRVRRRNDQQNGSNAPMRRFSTNGGVTNRVDNSGRPIPRQYRPGKGPVGATNPDLAARQSLQRRREAINRRASTPGGERAAGQEMRQVGRFLRAAQANDRARAQRFAGPAGPQGPGVDRMQAVERLRRIQRDANRRGGMRGDERRSGNQVREVGRYLQAAQANDRALADRMGKPRGPQGPGVRGMQARERLRRIQQEANRRGQMRGDERRSGDRVREVGRYLRAAEANDRARADRMSGPRGPQGPGVRGMQANERLQRIRRNANRRAAGMQDERRSGDRVREVGRYLGAAQANDRRGKPMGPRGPQRNQPPPPSVDLSLPRDYSADGAPGGGPAPARRYPSRRFKSAYEGSYETTEYDPAAAAWELED